MRTIKFRGKRKVDKVWVYGFFVVWRGKPYILTSTNESSPEWNEVFHDTVGQFTGLTDKEGNDIYEGDILEYVSVYDSTQKKALPVIYEERCGAWYIGANILSDLIHEQNNDVWKRKHNFEIHPNQYILIVRN